MNEQRQAPEGAEGQAMATVEPRVVVPLRRREEKRGAERFEMELPMAIGPAGAGVTRDMSVSGLSFMARQPYAVGEQIEVTV
ncbi:MAG: hypothetical protein EOO24_60140, partial [Comamonadaceae bacterium]